MITNNKFALNNLLRGLNRLSVFREILNDEIIKKAVQLIEAYLRNETEVEMERNTFELLYLLIGSKKSFHEYDAFAKYIFDNILKNENTFAVRAERKWDISDALKKVVESDIEILVGFATINFRELGLKNEDHIAIIGAGRKHYEGAYAVFNGSSYEITNNLLNYYRSFGTGEIGGFKGIKWEGDGKFSGISDFDHDPIRFENIVGMNYHKDILYKNTESFVKGMPANNVLLVGAGGTGKSSCVKAAANEFATTGLKIIEIDRKHIADIDKVFKWIRDRGGKFIVFMDDLSFEEHETDYKYLKSMLEGGIQKKPDNAIVYVTSNRRHLIKEVWQDRNEAVADIHETDSVNEKTSLSERFGLTLHFMSSNQEEYLEIVRGVAAQRKLDVDPETLRKEALKWSVSKNSRNGRSARQFIDYMQGLKTV